MNYSKSKAEKLVKEFDYLKDEKYYPYGKKGKEFDIVSLEVLVETIARHTMEYFASERENKTYGDEEDAKLAKGNNWFVKVNISDGETKIAADLKEVLSRLKIVNDIEKIPN